MPNVTEYQSSTKQLKIIKMINNKKSGFSFDLYFSPNSVSFLPVWLLAKLPILRFAYFLGGPGDTPNLQARRVTIRPSMPKVRYLWVPVLPAKRISRGSIVTYISHPPSIAFRTRCDSSPKADSPSPRSCSVLSFMLTRI